MGAGPDTLIGLLITLRAARVRLDTDAGGLRVDAPAGVLTEALREAIRRHRADLLTLPHPYLSDAGELITPSYAPPQFHWQPLAQTLCDLDAPPDVWRQHGRVPPGSPGD